MNDQNAGGGRRRKQLLTDAADCVEVLNAECEEYHALTDKTDATMKAAGAEIQRLRKLATDAYEAWDTDQDTRVGKLLRAMVDADFCRTYRPDLLPPNPESSCPPAAQGTTNE